MQLLLCSEEMSRVLPQKMMKLKISVAVEKGCKYDQMVRLIVSANARHMSIK